MSFAAPLAFLLLIPLVALFAVRVLPRPAAMGVADLGPLASAARPTLRLRLRRLPDLLRALAIVLLVVAVARPREGLATTLLPEESIDIVVSVDVSSSMLMRYTPEETRMEAARRVLDGFAASLQGNRMGLVAFQSRALTLSPLTSDVRSIQRRIDQLGPGLVEDGTAIGLGIAEALLLLEGSTARSRVVVLLTDGENNAGDVSPFEAARAAQALGVRIYTIGVTGGPFGQIDTRPLRDLAQLTGGDHFDARTPEELERAYEEVGALERSRIGEVRFLSFREFAPWIALVAALVLAVDVTLRSTWLRRQP